MAANDSPMSSMLEVSLREMTRMGHEYSTEWTNTWMYPWDAPEYVYTTAIGRSIRAATPGCVFLELNIDILKQDSRNAGLRGAKSKTTSKQSRVDVAVYRAEDGYPIFCMEVKKSHTDKKEIREDIKRCQEMVISAAQGSLHEAAVVFLLTKKDARIKIRVQKIFRNCSAKVSRDMTLWDLTGAENSPARSATWIFRNITTVTWTCGNMDGNGRMII